MLSGEKGRKNMNNSIVKLEDFELDEISGGITAKQVDEIVIKGASSLVLGVGTFFLSGFADDKLGYGDQLTNFLEEKLDNDLAGFLTFDVCGGIPTAFAGVAGWNFGSWLCKKLGLED